MQAMRDIVALGKCRKGAACPYCHEHIPAVAKARPAQSSRLKTQNAQLRQHIDTMQGRQEVSHTSTAARQEDTSLTGVAVIIPVDEGHKMGSIERTTRDEAGAWWCLLRATGLPSFWVPQKVARGMLEMPSRAALSDDVRTDAPVDALCSGGIGLCSALPTIGVGLVAVAGLAATGWWVSTRQTAPRRRPQPLLTHPHRRPQSPPRATFRSMQCVICLTHLGRPEVVFLPCNHMCMHRACFDRFRVRTPDAPCPVCRAPIHRRVYVQ